MYRKNANTDKNIIVIKGDLVKFIKIKKIDTKTKKMTNILFLKAKMLLHTRTLKIITICGIMLKPIVYTVVPSFKFVHFDSLKEYMLLLSPLRTSKITG